LQRERRTTQLNADMNVWIAGASVGRVPPLVPLSQTWNGSSEIDGQVIVSDRQWLDR
jgi:hypothetical protein